MHLFILFIIFFHYTWFVSRKVRNKLVHAINGNTSMNSNLRDIFLQAKKEKTKKEQINEKKQMVNTNLTAVIIWLY